MRISVDIVRSWRHPRRVMAERLREGVREDLALIYLMIACLLNFVAQWPRLLNEARLDPSVPFDARVGAALLGWMFIAPLFLYGLAGVSKIVAGLFGRKYSWYVARMALFWALLAASPLWMLNGLLAAFPALGALRTVVGIIALAGFVVIWITSLVEAGNHKGDP